ncbi:MAG: caspase family protein [Bacteroidales bacterium]|nr:caspase family protein [Bacteroidales bacterium]
MRIVAAFILLLFCSLASFADTFVVCVGIGNYADDRVHNLAKTEKDAKAMAEFYKRATENVITITGRYATKSRILTSLKSQFSRAKSGDKIIFYFSGHGYPGGFCPHEMRTLKDGIAYSEVVDIMKNSQASCKFIFADACNSGAIRQKGNGSGPEIGNVVFFLSSRGNEYSMESPFLANGYFTKHLLRGLGGGADADKDRRITVSELFKYVSDGVRSQTNDRQHPVMWGKFPDDLVVVSYSQK